MKSLKPSHRERKRYLLIKGKDANRNTVEKVILEFIGILGYSESGLSFIKSENKNFIIAINRKLVDKIRTSFLICNKDIKILKVSGSIKNLI